VASATLVPEGSFRVSLIARSRSIRNAGQEGLSVIMFFVRHEVASRDVTMIHLGLRMQTLVSVDKITYLQHSPPMQQA
jgi:hypothetical protein